ncbi:hypothetical protein ACOSP7_019922 [Xanthoceras sorbifolium]
MGSEDHPEGPWGGINGREWKYMLESGIIEITIHYGEVIDSLSFKNISENRPLEHFGGKCGNFTKTIQINSPSEYFTSISGNSIMYDQQRVVASLCFTTNDGTTYSADGTSKGQQSGIPFELPLKNQAIVGFFGREANFIDAIGVHCKDLPKPIVTSKVNSAITMAMDLPREVGPWGGNKGKSWDHGVFGGLNQIEVHVGNGVIHAIRCRYQNRDDKPVLSKLQGGGGASTIYKIELDPHCSCEYLIGITGFYGAVDGNCCQEVVRSISFYTNKGKHGPFGSETGTFFSSPVSNAKVVGFHGRSGEYLDAIGVHVEYC